MYMNIVPSTVEVPYTTEYKPYFNGGCQAE